MTQARLTKIGKYEVESVVGEGAMGVVYCAVDSMLNRRVAIKVMSDAIAQDTDLRERFLREAQAAGSLQHPNVVTVYDFGDVDGHLYIAMEYVEGQDLEDLLRSKIALPLEARLELMIGVLQGLAFAHKRGVIHRDIKPANIRVDGEGKARIMDFGVAHLASSDMTRTGTMLGTPSYMAPEQILGGPVSPQTDIFSVGAVLYELLTNVRPFKGDTLQTLMYQILSTMPSPIDQVAPELPPELNRIVMRALQKEPKDRYAKALDMANDLTMVRASRSQDGTSSSLSLRATIDTAIADRVAIAQRTARRRRMASIATGVLAATVVLGVGYQVWQWNSAGGAPGDSAQPLVSASASGVVADSGAGAGGAARNPAAPGNTTTPPSTPAAPAESAGGTSAPGAAKTLPAPPKPTGPTPQEIAVARGFQRSALDDRRRASEAGATAEQLRAGDRLNTSGESALQRGRTLDAADAFNQAASSWRAAERTARQEAAARTAAAPPGTPPVTGPPANSLVPRPADPQVTIPATQPGSTTAVTPPPVPVSLPAPPPKVAANPGPEINSIIAAYARAIESRDITELRRVYPGMTADQRKAFEDFFRATRSLNASLTVSDLQVTGSTAEARLTGTYVYVTSTGATERRPVAFRATLTNDGGAWKLTTVR